MEFNMTFNPIDIDPDYQPTEIAETDPKEFYVYQDPYFGYDTNPRLKIWIAYKETPKGYWVVPIHDCLGDVVNVKRKKWVMKPELTLPNRKRIMYDTKDDAMYSYYRKKLEHIKHLEEKLSQIRLIIQRIEVNHNVDGIPKPKDKFLNEDEFTVM